MRFFLQISLPLTFWNLIECKAEDHPRPTEFLNEMCSEIFFKMGGLMSNLWKCTNQLFGAAQPIVMYKPEQWTRPYHLWEGGCTCFGAWGLSRFLFMFTPYLHNFGFISYLQLLQKKSINGSSTSWSKVHFSDGNNTGIRMKSSWP